MQRGTEYLSLLLYRKSDPYEIEADEITRKVFGEVYQYLKDMMKMDTNFNPAFMTKMLLLIDEQIEKYSSSAKHHFNFLIDYKLEMYLIACSYSISLFEIMARLFTEKNDPLIYLENHERGPLLIMFKNQYNQTEAEEAIANSLCAYIREQIDKSIGPKMVSKIKHSVHHFSSKMALKVKILTDIGEGKEEHIYQRYYILRRKHKIGANSEGVKEEVTDLIAAVENVVTTVNENNIHDVVV